MFCYKKPKYYSDAINLYKLIHYQVTSSYSINYELCCPIMNVFRYKKVKHDPLSYQDAEKYLYELLQELFKVCGVLSSKGIQHSDVRVPNICFNKQYEPVLIDFDDANICKSAVHPQADLQVFVDDLIEHSKLVWILHESDIRTHCAMSIKEVICNSLGSYES